jgi:hypothetical protein
MKYSIFAALIAGSFVASSAIAAPKPTAEITQPQILVTEVSTNDGYRTYAVDFYSDGKAVGLQADLKPTGAKLGQTDISGCSTAKSTDKANQGGCSLVEGVIRFVVVNFELRPLAAGWHNLGTFRLMASGKAGISQTKLLLSDADGNQLPVSFSFAAEE